MSQLDQTVKPGERKWTPFGEPEKPAMPDEKPELPIPSANVSDAVGSPISIFMLPWDKDGNIVIIDENAVSTGNYISSDTWVNAGYSKQLTVANTPTTFLPVRKIPKGISNSAVFSFMLSCGEYISIVNWICNSIGGS